jgi:hypothetical protein
MRFQKAVLCVFKSKFFKKINFQTVDFLRFGLKLHFLFTKLQSQTHPNNLLTLIFFNIPTI